MRYLWIFVVLSGAAFGQNAYGPDFLNLHCTAPDPLAQVLFNIPPRPGLVPDHSANGNVVFYCDAASSTFKASFNGGPYGNLLAAAGVAVGSQFVSNGVGLGGIYQTKLAIDVRDYGVVGDGATDDTTALNNAFSALANFGTLNLPPPPNCKIKITSTITVANKFGISVRQPGEADSGQTCGFFWFGTSGGTMLFVKEVHGSEWHNLSFKCSGSGTGFVSTPGCNIAILVDESATPSNITTNTAFFDININNANANSSFVGMDIGPNAPGNVENNYIYNTKVFCGGPAGGDTDTGIRIGSAATGSQPNNNRIIGGNGPTNCGRGYWIRGNTNATDIGNVGPGVNFNTLYIAGANFVHYHDIEDQVTTTPIHIAASGVGLLIENYQTSGITGNDIQSDTAAGFNISARNVKFSAPTTLNLTGTAMQWEDFNVQGQDGTFCGTLQKLTSFKVVSSTCGISQVPNLALAGATGLNVSGAYTTNFSISAGSVTAGQVVKIDTAHANSVVTTAITDTGAGIPIGITQNSATVGAFADVITSGMSTAAVLGTGTCAIGQFVIVDTTTAGRVQCTGTFTAGTVIGKAMTAQNTVGNTVNVLVQLQ